jgi:hypothetical protein
MLRFLKLANSLAFRHFQGVLRPSSLSQTPILHGKTSRHWTVTILARMSSTGDENATTGYVPMQLTILISKYTVWYLEYSILNQNFGSFCMGYILSLEKCVSVSFELEICL